VFSFGGKRAGGFFIAIETAGNGNDSVICLAVRLLCYHCILMYFVLCIFMHFVVCVCERGMALLPVSCHVPGEEASAFRT